MGLRIIPATDYDKTLKERIIIYGRSGIGKSRLALSLPERFGRIAYYAADENAEFLPSISKDKRSRILVIKPEGDDAIKNFTKFCLNDWKKVDPGIQTLVVDTFTKVANDAIRHSANTGSVTSEKHYQVGDPGEGGQIIPNRGDYLALESLARGFLDMLFEHQRDMHIIFVQHEDVKLIEGIHAVGGPAVPGRAMLEYIPSQMSTVIRLIRETTLLPGASMPEEIVVAITENDGRFITKVRTTNDSSANPLAKVYLDRTSRNFWTEYEKIYAPKEEEVNVG